MTTLPQLFSNICRKFARTTLISLCAVCATTYAQPSSAQIQRIVSKALQQSEHPAFTGIVIQSMKTGKILYQSQADYHFVPASTLKLVTAIAALAYLKPDYRYHTQILTDNTAIQNHTLQGNVWFKFEGDPTLKRRNLAELIATFKQRGIQHIKGHVYVDVSSYDNVLYPPGWLYDDFSYAYAAPTSALVLNKNKFLLAIEPNQGNNTRVTLSTPRLPKGMAHFDNQLVSTNNTKDCPIAIYAHLDNSYRLKGCVQKNYKKQHRVLAITDPVLFGRQWIKQSLRDQHISYPGRITVNSANKHATKRLSEHRSAPLSQLATSMLKKSDNLIADAFLKTLGQRYYHTAGTWQNGVKALQAVLSPLTGIDFKNTLITDGAGLSRYNLITPMQLAKLLNYAYHDLQIEPELLAAMPIAGKDGTLEYRMRELQPPRNVRGKTGSMNGVSGLAGYLTTTDKDVLSYVILMNNFVGKVKDYRKIEDQICVALTGQQTRTG